jgi:hypothetical protein
MLRELTAINAERRAVARREQLTETRMGLLSAAIAAAGLIWATQRARSGQLTAGEVVALTQGMVGVQGSVGGAIGWIAEINSGLINTGHHVTVVGAEPDLPVRDPASGTILHLMPGVAQAEQVTRELLVEVWRKAAWFDPGRHRGRAWLVAMARQGAVERARFFAPDHDLGGRSASGSPIIAALSAPVPPRG